MRFSAEIRHYPSRTVKWGDGVILDVPAKWDTDTTRVLNFKWAVLPPFDPLEPTRIVISGEIEDHICPLLGESE